MAPFARDMGHVGDAGDVLPPFIWDEDRLLHLRARLDALYFILYGVFDPAHPAKGRDDVRYIYSTFSIIERQEVAAYGHYRSRDPCLAYINTLIAGSPTPSSPDNMARKPLPALHDGEIYCLDIGIAAARLGTTRRRLVERAIAGKFRSWKINMEFPHASRNQTSHRSARRSSPPIASSAYSRPDQRPHGNKPSSRRCIHRSLLLNDFAILNSEKAPRSKEIICS